jgi:integrase
MDKLFLNSNLSRISAECGSRGWSRSTSNKYVLAIATGMREGELFALTWNDVDFKGAAVTVSKTLEDIAGQQRTKEPKTRKSRRRIDLPAFSVEVLHEHRKRMLSEGNASGPVFCDRAGGYLRRQNVLRRSLRPLMKAAGVPTIRFHDLRHTSATLLLLAGENPKVVSERLGARRGQHHA